MTAPDRRLSWPRGRPGKSQNRRSAACWSSSRTEVRRPSSAGETTAGAIEWPGGVTRGAGTDRCTQWCASQFGRGSEGPPARSLAARPPSSGTRLFLAPPSAKRSDVPCGNESLASFSRCPLTVRRAASRTARRVVPKTVRRTPCRQHGHSRPVRTTSGAGYCRGRSPADT